tara:strand:- start:516 stop:800 length:285 start_codon:yes stop_codon:yes gene_type:complete
MEDGNRLVYLVHCEVWSDGNMLEYSTDEILEDIKGRIDELGPHCFWEEHHSYDYACDLNDSYMLVKETKGWLTTISMGKFTKNRDGEFPRLFGA